MEVASRESTVGSGLTYRAAAVATKKIVAAAKKQRGRMGVGHWGPRGEVGEECQEEAWHWKDDAGGQGSGNWMKIGSRSTWEGSTTDEVGGVCG